MRRVIPWLVMVVGGVLLCAFGGCAISPPVRFYVLTPLPDMAPLQPQASGVPSLALGIGPVTVPEYLDRSEIIRQASANQLDLAEFDQWAEPLKASVPRVLADNLSRLLHTDAVALIPGPRRALFDYQVVAEVTRFEATLGGSTRLVARWGILNGDGEQEYVRRQSTITVPVNAPSYDAMVAAMSQALGELSRDIAGALQALPPAAPRR